MRNHDEKPDTHPETDQPQTGRREALLKIGKYGAYVAPAVLALTLGKRADAFCSCA
jgi:hypothetical protein